MKTAVFLISCLVAAMALAPQGALAASSQVPDDYLDEPEHTLVGGAGSRKKRTIQLDATEYKNQGAISAQAQKTVYSDPKTSVDATVSGSSQWTKGGTPQNAVSTRLDVQRNLLDNGKSKVDASGSIQRDTATGMNPHYSGSVRMDAKTNLYSSPNTQVNANAFAQRNMAAGSQPQDSFGAGVEATRTLASSKGGTLDAYTGYKGQWDGNTRHVINSGFTWNF